MIIDYRLRPPYEGYFGTQMYSAEVIRWINAVVHSSTPNGPEAARLGSMGLMIKEMDAAGIAIGVAPGRYRPGTEIPNAVLHRLTQAFPGRFVALGSVNVLDLKQAFAHLDESVRYEFPGIALDLSVLGMTVDDPRMYPIYARCGDLSLSVTITLSGLSSGLALIRPEGLDNAARDFPATTFVSAHASFPFITEIIGVAMKRSNVWLSPDMYMTHTPGGDLYVQAANGYLRDRMLFGTAYPYTSLKDTVDRFMKLPLEPEVRELVLEKNARRLLRLSS